MLNYKVEARLVSPGIRAEIREIFWDDEVEVDLEWDSYQLGCSVTWRRKHERPLWRLPNGEQVAAALFGVVPPNIPIGFKRMKGPIRNLSCSIDKEYFEATTGLDHLTTDDLQALLRSSDSFVRALLDRIVAEVIQPGPNSSVLLSSLIECVLLEIPRLLRTVTARKGEGKLLDWQLRKLRDVIEESRYQDDLSLTSLAAMCGISGRHLMRGFKATTGMTIHAYIEQERLKRAKQLLEEGDTPLKCVASEMGFSSPSHMSLVFRKLTGMTPSAYRSLSRTKGQAPVHPNLGARSAAPAYRAQA